MIVRAVLIVNAVWYGGNRAHTEALPVRSLGSNASTSAAAPTIELSDSQLPSIQVGSVQLYSFPIEKEAVGNIDFDEDLSVQVFPPYQGKIIEAFAQLGDDVSKGRPLYTIDSPDLIQAESTLIGAAATLDLTNKELVRAKALYEAGKGVAELGVRTGHL